MFILAQHYFFAQNEGLTVQQLAKALSRSESTIRKIAKELLEKSLIKQRGEKPAYYYIDRSYFEA